MAQVAAAYANAVYILPPWPKRYAPIGTLWRENVSPLAGPDSREGDSLGDPPKWILLLDCDLPCLQEQILKGWRQRLTESALLDSGRLAQKSTRLCGFYRLAQLGSLESFLQAGGRSFQVWLSQVPTAILPLADVTMLTNCNTPADLQLGQKPGKG